MRTTMKIVTILMLALIMVTVTTNSVLAFDPGAIINDVDNTANTSGSNSNVNDIAGKVVGLIRNIAVVAGVIVLSIIGVKFMIGSAEEKAEYKKSLIPLVVGIIVVMAATQIIAMIFGFF